MLTIRRMFGKRGTFAFAMFLLVSISATPLLSLQPPEDGQETAASVQPQAGSFLFAGGPVIGKRARTNTTAINIAETPGWVSLPGALTWVVPVGTTHLFNVAYSAECRLFNGGGDDWLRIRILDVVGGVGTPLEPYDGQQAFCSADAYATHKGNWVKRAQPGVHNLIVQVLIFDGPPAEVLTARIDDSTFELVVYN
jgi:hypothetical protein